MENKNHEFQQLKLIFSAYPNVLFNNEFITLNVEQK